MQCSVFFIFKSKVIYIPNGDPKQRHKLAKKQKMRRHFHLQTSLVFRSIFKQQKYFSASYLSTSRCSHVHSFFTKEEQKKVDYWLFDTCIIHAGRVHDVTLTGCWAQSGSTLSRVFATFKHCFKKKRPGNGVKKSKQTKKLLCGYFLFHFSWQGLWCLFALSPF